MQCFDFIRGFLELVGNSPENENSESSMLQGLKAEQAGETALRSHFCGTAVFGSTDRYWCFCFTIYLPNMGLPTFCMWTACTGRCVAYPAKTEVFLQMFFDSYI